VAALAARGEGVTPAGEPPRNGKHPAESDMHTHPTVSRRHFLRLGAAAAVLGPAALAADADAWPETLIGYTEFRTDLPGGRYVNQATFRAVVVKADGTGRRVLSEELTREKNSWTQLRGWSPDGEVAVFSREWMSDENGQWEEEHKDFRYPKDGYSCDGYLFDLATGKATNVTAVERVSHANQYLQFWPDEKTLYFQAIVDGTSRPYLMDLNGKNKRELIRKTPSLVHGMSVSPDGKRGAYEDSAYRLFLADADGSNATQIKTGLRFHLLPSWSPDGAWVLFVAGEHYDCHPHVVKADGTGLKKLASRNGYRGVIDYLDVYDFHDGSSDLPVWAPDGQSVFYTAKVGKNVELFRVTLDGKSEQLTETAAGSMHYHPNPSPDGKWVLYGSKRDGVRQLYVMRLGDKKERRITDLKEGHAAMWASWRKGSKMR
jgi:Tol biopolymer transport system component